MSQAVKEKKINQSSKVSCFFSNVRENLGHVVHDFKFDAFILSIILLNAFVLGAMAFPEVYMIMGKALTAIDQICVIIFVIELALKIFVMGRSFFKDNWNVFDFTVVALSLIPNTGAFIIIRTFRVFRVLRLLSILPSMRRVLTMFLETLPSVFSTFFLMVIVFYVFGVMSVYLFGSFMVDFSNLTSAFEVLFGFLTFDGWSSERAQLAMSLYPYSWVFFTAFVSVFMLMIINVFSSAVVEGIRNLRVEHEKEMKEAGSLKERIVKIEKDQAEILELLRDLRKK